MLLMIEKPQASLADRTACALSRTAKSALTVADALLLWPFRVAENRRMLQALAGMSDRDLRDIGLTRGDLRDVGAQPIARDVGTLLAARRAERRRAPAYRACAGGGRRP